MRGKKNIHGGKAANHNKGIRKTFLWFLALITVGAITLIFWHDSLDGKVDATASATILVGKDGQYARNMKNSDGKKVLIILCSGSTGNTRILANAIAEEMDADIFELGESSVIPDILESYALIGFGSGIFSGQHHSLLLEQVVSLSRFDGKQAFIFSTNGAPAAGFSGDGVRADTYMDANHKALRDLLLDRGFIISGEFSCPGLNRNSFLKCFGGFNKGRPNREDLDNAREFAIGLLSQI